MPTNTEPYMILEAPEMVIGRARLSVILSAFAELRASGCTVTWADEHRTLTRVRYYNLKIEGPEAELEMFQAWFTSLSRRR